MNVSSLSTVGGMFGLEIGGANRTQNRGTAPLFLRGDPLLLTMARSAFLILHRTLKPGKVWLPSYLCDVVLGALPGDAICFFAIDERLQIIERDWMNDVHEGDMVVFIDYFGFNNWESTGAEARAKGAWVIEDACHALVNSRFSEHAHFVVCSPRKFVGVPDGGILIAQGGAETPVWKLENPPTVWSMDALNASVRRAMFDYAAEAGENGWFSMYQRSEATAPLSPFAMSELTQFILRNVVDWTAVAARRRFNYEWLAERFGDLAIFPHLPEEVVPLGFPVRLTNRGEVRQRFFDDHIFPAIHWACPEEVSPAFEHAHRLSGQILSIPCDQRVTATELERIAAVMRTAEKIP